MNGQWRHNLKNPEGITHFRNGAPVIGGVIIYYRYLSATLSLRDAEGEGL